MTLTALLECTLGFPYNGPLGPPNFFLYSRVGILPSLVFFGLHHICAQRILLVGKGSILQQGFNLEFPFIFSIFSGFLYKFSQCLVFKAVSPPLIPLMEFQNRPLHSAVQGCRLATPMLRSVPAIAFALFPVSVPIGIVIDTVTLYRRCPTDFRAEASPGLQKWQQSQFPNSQMWRARTV